MNNRNNINYEIKKSEHYCSIDGLRTISCLGIILMHIQANTNYHLKGSFLYDKIIPSFTWLVYLFLIISGFGMCVGYLNKFHTNSIDLDEFYRKRYKKILPFFMFLLFIALLIEHNISTIYEISIELTLLHGLLPNNAVSVIGVCWTLGVIFLFYLMFLAFSVLMKSKVRAWLSLLVSLWIVIVCNNYFFNDYFVTNSFTPRHNFLYCAPMFISGGILYLYRDKIKNHYSKYRLELLLVSVVLTVLWFIIPLNSNFLFYLSCLIVFCLWLSYAIAIDSKFLGSKLMKFLANISLEMYLSQMVIFRIVEKLNLLYIFGDTGIQGWISFFFSFILIVFGLVSFIECYNFFFKILKKKGFCNEKK